MAAYTSPFIGYPGSPKDYSSLEAMRKRQKDVDDKAAKARTQKELDEIMKATDIDPGKYLPFRIPQVKGIMAEGVDKILKAASAGDYSALQEAKNDIMLRSGNFVKEREDFDNVIKSNETGQTYTPVDYRSVYSGKGIEDFQSMIDSGALSVHKETGRLVPTSYENTDIPRYTLNIVKEYKNLPTGKTDSLGRNVYDTDVPGLTYALGVAFDNDPAMAKKFSSLNQNRISKEGKSPDQINAEMRDLYIQDGINMAVPNKVTNPSKGNNFNFSFGNGEQDARIATEGNNQAINTTYVDPVSGEMKVGTFTVARFQGVGDKKATMPISAYAYNVETGRPVTTSANEQFVFNGFGDINVLTQDFKVTARNGEVVTYEKGAPIPDEYVPYAQKAGAVKKILGAQVKGESGTMVMPADIFMQSAAFDEATSDKEAITAAFNKAKAPYKNGSFSVSTTGGSKQTKSGGASSKAQGGEKTKSTATKPLSPSAKKRSEGNPALQELLRNK